LTSAKRKLPFDEDSEVDYEKLVDGILQLEPSPPIGCFVKEDVDLGGWMIWDGQTKIRENYGIGRLNLLMEKFNPEDDCDRK
jgi:hypothetical protein